MFNTTFPNTEKRVEKETYSIVFLANFFLIIFFTINSNIYLQRGTMHNITLHCSNRLLQDYLTYMYSVSYEERLRHYYKFSAKLLMYSCAYMASF